MREGGSGVCRAKSVKQESHDVWTRAAERHDVIRDVTLSRQCHGVDVVMVFTLSWR